VLCAEQFRNALARELLDGVDLRLTFVVPLVRIAFRVLVAQHRAGRFEHRPRGVVLARDQANRVTLVALLGLDEVCDFRIHLRERRLMPRDLFRGVHGERP
jgi:hypothetical protein